MWYVLWSETGLWIKKKCIEKKRPIAIKKDKAGLTGEGDIEVGQPRMVKELQWLARSYKEIQSELVFLFFFNSQWIFIYIN